jgi:hypothetical protein
MNNNSAAAYTAPGKVLVFGYEIPRVDSVVIAVGAVNNPQTVAMPFEQVRKFLSGKPLRGVGRRKRPKGR